MHQQSSGKAHRGSKLIPVDDEPLTADDLEAIRQAEEDFARGDYVTLEELTEDVARQRSKSRAKKVPAKRSAR